MGARAYYSSEAPSKYSHRPPLTAPCPISLSTFSTAGPPFLAPLQGRRPRMPLHPYLPVPLQTILQLGVGGGVKAGCNVWRALRNIEGERAMHTTWRHLGGKGITGEWQLGHHRGKVITGERAPSLPPPLIFVLWSRAGRG